MALSYYNKDVPPPPTGCSPEETAEWYAKYEKSREAVLEDLEILIQHALASYAAHRSTALITERSSEGLYAAISELASLWHGKERDRILMHADAVVAPF